MTTSAAEGNLCSTHRMKISQLRDSILLAVDRGWDRGRGYVRVRSLLAVQLSPELKSWARVVLMYICNFHVNGYRWTPNTFLVSVEYRLWPPKVFWRSELCQSISIANQNNQSCKYRQHVHHSLFNITEAIPSWPLTREFVQMCD